MLREQGKVRGDLAKKLDRCRLLCIATIDSEAVAIGAIKAATKTDFDCDKADMPNLAEEYQWELGYLFTRHDYGGRGLASQIVRKLLETYGGYPIMASTEESENPGMTRILEKAGFKPSGRPWTSDIHDNLLRLYLRQ